LAVSSVFGSAGEHANRHGQSPWKARPDFSPSAESEASEAAAIAPADASDFNLPATLPPLPTANQATSKGIYFLSRVPMRLSNLFAFSPKMSYVPGGMDQGGSRLLEGQVRRSRPQETRGNTGARPFFGLARPRPRRPPQTRVAARSARPAVARAGSRAGTFPRRLAGRLLRWSVRA
jgi:hypothetical protein